MGKLLKHLSICMGKSLNLSSAEDYLEASLKVARGLGKRKDELEVLLGFGKTCARSKEMDQALSLLKEGLDRAEKYRDNVYEGLFLVQMGDIYNRRNEKQKSMESYMKALGPLKNAKELKLIDEINLRLNQSFDLEEGESEKKPVKSNRVIQPVKKTQPRQRYRLGAS